MNIYWKDINKGIQVIEHPHSFTTKNGDLIYWHGKESHEAQSYLKNRSLTKPVIVMETKEDVLKACKVKDNIVFLPTVKLSKELYNEVKKSLKLIGGKWEGGKIFGFVFQSDPTELLEQIAQGEKRNLKKEFQFFATPDDLAYKLVEMAEINDGDCILEPSAGQGAIIKAIYKYQPRIMLSASDKPCTTIDYCEIMETNQIILGKIIDKSRTSFVCADFLQIKAGEPFIYDRIIANPPFSKNQDIDHIYKMYECLKKGGRLVSIASKHWHLSENKKEKKFKEWLLQVNADIRELPSGEFKESGTMISSCIVIINK